MDNTQTEAVPQADGLVDGGPSIVEEVREQADEQYVESAEGVESEEQVDFSAPEVETESETIPENEWEIEARKFQ